MKNSKGETLPQPYYDLALMRRDQSGRESFDVLLEAFTWIDSFEGGVFWAKVSDGETPDIPATSLAELDEWRAKKLEANVIKIMDTLPEPALDYNAMYEELKTAADALISEYKELKAMYDELLQKHADLVVQNAELRTSITPTRNWIAECAMAAMQGLPALLHAQYSGAPSDETIAKKAWDYAEAWAAEGKKRGHI